MSAAGLSPPGVAISPVLGVAKSEPLDVAAGATGGFEVVEVDEVVVVVVVLEVLASCDTPPLGPETLFSQSLKARMAMNLHMPEGYAAFLEE